MWSWEGAARIIALTSDARVPEAPPTPFLFCAALNESDKDRPLQQPSMRERGCRRAGFRFHDGPGRVRRM